MGYLVLWTIGIVACTELSTLLFNQWEIKSEHIPLNILLVSLSNTFDRKQKKVYKIPEPVEIPGSDDEIWGRSPTPEETYTGIADDDEWPVEIIGEEVNYWGEVLFVKHALLNLINSCLHY